MNFRSIIAFLGAGLIFSSCSAAWTGSSAALPARTVTSPDAAPMSRGLNMVDAAKVRAQIAVTFEDSYKVNSALVYAMSNRKNRKPLCEISPKLALSGSPAGDSDGDIWLPVFYFGSSYLQSQVVEYAPNCGKPILTLQDSYSSVADVYVAPDGTVYITNFSITTVSPGNILVYKKGKTTPAETLGQANEVYFIGVTANTKKHDILATYSECDSCNLGLMVFRNSGGTGVPIKDPAIYDPGIPTIDKNGVVLVPDRTTLRTYSSPYTKPGKTYALEGESFQCSLNKSQADIACSDYQNGTVDVYAYPSMKYNYSFSKAFQSEGAVWGVAQTPN